ncbi:hypothetical protein K493DRAFT_86991 [Basidiobolus meristosporus CBS 931.73]|uniref:Uncharacterized protein n=1 Tax=Basidiobolus meristosporus CBS 931.73 TaxID=1314790 RepID=A0A1Y1XFU8_9FUNG|nr:hypothetical protein K493DRAFT_86991 [Basidiobolus meristosporus CBS 931.73]|eukprot:ORX84572.1 hypothetical protein K493DRAFT_86991 [Basidiobolus meristosporus CBS 931.73]
MNARPVMLSPIRRISANTNPPKTAALEGLFYTDALLPFIYLWGVLLAYCTLAMHIQVITRFFSCMPTVTGLQLMCWYRIPSIMRCPFVWSYFILSRTV